MLEFIKSIIPGRIKKSVKVFFHPERYILSTKQIPFEYTYNKDGLITNHVCHFLQDEKFIEAYKVSIDTEDMKDYKDGFEWRVHVALWAAIKGVSLEGDFVECGVDRGALSKTIVHYLEFQKVNKLFYLLDTFNGIPTTLFTKEELELNNPHIRHYTNTFEIAKKRFKDYENVILIKGMVPDTLSQVKSEKIAYLSIDMNNAASEIAAVEYFWDKLVCGAVIVLDDYAYAEAYRIQRIEFDKFAKKKGITILTLPTGQGLIIKP